MNQPPSRVRQQLSQWSFLVSAAFLISCGVMYAEMWRVAADDGMVPYSGGNYGNHGPWSHYRIGLIYLGYIIELSIFAAAASLLSLIAHPTLRAGIALMLSIVIFLMMVFGHIWLYD